ncbi:Piso0_002213 [Millerozyma farinosa CBS 7064]|uniref:Piso0_002213 protein n=1 Tax=Pichia sorbitophila (strain ATCC MYA-4447 / BCRC 22081 / CBS 7064 / NBRC 10061 / NRRL Y-12695) TaxID=559304 RepID=G8YC05_PICSO|nr:Piso0_002213 [Millerozyma farinosa CBS 7064]
MDIWSEERSGIASDKSLSLGLEGGSSKLRDSDPILSKVLAGKRQLQAELELKLDKQEEEESKLNFFSAVCDGDLVTFENALRSDGNLVESFFPSKEEGFTSLIYAICFDQREIAESLLSRHGCDPDTCDTSVGYTPLMWAVYCDSLEMVKLLLNHQADPYLSSEDGAKNAITLLNPENVGIREFFQSHNLLEQKSHVLGEDNEMFGTNFETSDSVVEDDLSNKIKLQSISAKAPFLEEENQEQEAEELDDEYKLARDPVLFNMPDFEYNKLLPDQFIKFSDSDIPSLLDYIFGLRTEKVTFQHDTKVPAAIIFQLIRFSHKKVDSKELTQFLFDCFTARLRSVTNTKSGAFNMTVSEEESPLGSGDIVLQSYWLSVIQFLHFYFAKGDIYKHFPSFLQELINITQSLIASLSFSINSRLNILLDDCILNFTNLVDVSNVLYAKEWNFFKYKRKAHPSTYDDIYNMLYPPSERELMKPSPVKYIQVLGALDYVLKLHEVDPLFKSQVFSQVFYYINAIIFNRIISSSKYCSRSKAIQIRLNMSTLEDWLRSHNFKVYKPDTIGLLESLCVPNGNTKLHNVLGGSDNTKDPHYLPFYYNSLFHIGKRHLSCTIELLQWLQCMTSITTEESLVNTINQFESLNYYQINKVASKLYKYEVSETKFPKSLVQFLKSLANERGENQVSKLAMHYMTQSNLLSKEVYIYINPNHIFNAALPNIAEMIRNYGSGIGGVKVLRARKYQPSLPIEVLDDIEERLSQNKLSFNDTNDYEAQDDTFDDDNEETENRGGTDALQAKNGAGFKGDELFKEVSLPSSLAHKNWGDDDIETNPW